MRSTPMSVVDSLQKRCDTSNNANATYFVSIHNNAADAESASGTETWDNPGNAESAKLASNIQNNIVQQLGTYDRGYKGWIWKRSLCYKEYKCTSCINRIRIFNKY